MKIITTPNAAASQTEHPWRATARTLIQSALGAGVTILGVLILVPGAMDELAAALGELGIVVPAVLIALPPVIARIMAIPGIERALRGIGLGAAPTEAYLPEEDVYPADGDMEDGWYIEPEDEPEDEEQVIDEAGDPRDPAGDPPPFEPEDEQEVAYDLDESSLEQAAAAEVDLTPPPDGYEPRH